MNQHQAAKTGLGVRLMSRIDPQPQGCWEWQGARTASGYGRMSWRNHVERAHRLAAHLWLGFDLSSEQIVMHTCDNPPCIRPDHLWVGSLRDNTQDMVSKGRNYAGPEPRDTCDRGHNLTGENGVVISGKVRCRECKARWNREYRARRRVIVLAGMLDVEVNP